ncbi:MAG: VOC family protein [Rhodobacterales bacterium]|jgi:glyoxylase I family protein|tara:strand:- start:312 stop:734 length:423 start_codon:yes stop_codon:yes gene_type:complete
MKLKLHHINLCTENVERMDAFYKDVLQLSGDETADLPTLEKGKGYSGDVAFITDGTIQTHIAQKDQLAGFNTKQFVNPVERGHIAYRTDDIVEFKAHLDSKGIKYSDWGNAAVNGWHQVFFYDPDGNVIEVHEVENNNIY